MQLVILISLPLTPYVWERAVLTFGAGFSNFPYMFSVALLLFFFYIMVGSWRDYGPFRIIALAALSMGYGYVLKYYCKFPAEKLHLVEYGALVFLALRAFSFDFSTRFSYALAFLFGLVFGSIDESIQYFLPNRTFETRDIVTNGLASAFGLALIALLTKRSRGKMPLERLK